MNDAHLPNNVQAHFIPFVQDANCWLEPAWSSGPPGKGEGLHFSSLEIGLRFSLWAAQVSPDPREGPGTQPFLQKRCIQAGSVGLSQPSGGRSSFSIVQNQLI